jgi:hypothetical protein
MHLILLALGLIMALAGLALVAFGIATSAGAFANTLIVIGTIAIAGGLILIGLASAIGHLRRIAQALESRPLPRALGREPAAAAPHVPFVAPLSAPRTRAEPGAEAPAPPPPPPPPPEPAIETPHAADRDRVAPPQEMPQPAMSERPAETPPSLPEPRPMPEAAAEQKFDTVWTGEPAAETPHDVDAGRISATEPEPADTGEDAWAPAGADEVRIFKSGVIDGMAYTLYTDGSIEAELAQGTVKFSSIDELRAYLATRE